MHMRAIAFVLACLPIVGHTHQVQPQEKQVRPRVEIFVIDGSNKASMKQRIAARAQYWAARGSQMKFCQPQPKANALEALAQLLVASDPAAAWQATGALHSRGLTTPLRATRAGMSPQLSVGLYYSTSTGNTETVAGYIAEQLGNEDWKDIGDAEDDEVLGHDAIIVGAPTWHTGADSERSGTSWDEWLYGTLPDLDLSGKKVAIFGVGDSASYGENYCDACGEIYEQFTARGAKVYGMTPSSEGFDYTESKSVIDGKFVGKMFDEDNYADESEERAEAWLEQLKSEGFM